MHERMTKLWLLIVPLAEGLWPAEERPVRPLMPLRRGDLAVLIAAGFLNNILLEADGCRHAFELLSGLLSTDAHRAEAFTFPRGHALNMVAWLRHF